MKRSGKFYYRNEKETLETLGFKQVPGSGNGWIAKEDGESENTLVQLKSTESSSYTLQMLDLKKLEVHAETANKFPLFLVQFLKHDKIYAVVSVENIADLTQMLKTGKVQDRTVKFDSRSSLVERKKVSSSSKAINSYRKEMQDKWKRKK